MDEVTASQEGYQRITPSPSNSSRLPLSLLAFPPSRKATVLLRRFTCSACTCSCTSLMLEKTRLAGDTDADIGVEMTVGTLVACGNVDQALSLGFGLARARFQQDCLLHQERLLSSGRKSSDGQRFYTRKRRSSLPCVGSTPEPPEQSEVRRQLEEAHAGIWAQTCVGRVR